MTRGEFAEFADEFASLDVSGYGELLARRAGTRHQVERLLRSYLDWRLHAGGLAGRSHVHNNGFVKLGLWRHSDTASSIRLHAWLPDPESSASQTPSVHDHRWSFASVGVAGQLQFINYEPIEAPDGDWMMRRVSDADAQGDKQVLRATPCRLVEVCSYQIGPGLVHSLDYRQLHRTPAPQSYAVTLVMTAPPAREFSRVVEPLSKPPGKLVTSQRSLDVAEVVRVTKEVIERIHAAP